MQIDYQINSNSRFFLRSGPNCVIYETCWSSFLRIALHCFHHLSIHLPTHFRCSYLSGIIQRYPVIIFREQSRCLRLGIPPFTIFYTKSHSYSIWSQYCFKNPFHILKPILLSMTSAVTSCYFWRSLMLVGLKHPIHLFSGLLITIHAHWRWSRHQLCSWLPYQ